CRTGAPHSVNSHRTRDILELLLASILKSHIQSIPHLLMRGIRDADAAWLRNTFQAGGNIDAIAEDVIACDQHVAEIDADTEQHLAVLGHIRVPLGHALMY